MFSGGEYEVITKKIDTSGLHIDNKHEKLNKHTEISANYRYRCKKPSELSTITIGLFKTFQEIRIIHAQWTIENKQDEIMLNVDHKFILLR